MIITVANAKGGTGKTFWSTALLYYLCLRKRENPDWNKEVWACDLDVAQYNFYGNVMDFQRNYKLNANIFNSIQFCEFADLKKFKGNPDAYVICDTPPATWDSKYLKLLEMSDLLILPLKMDKYSGQALGNLLAKCPEGGKYQIIANMYGDSATEQEVRSFILKNYKAPFTARFLQWMNSNIQQCFSLDRGLREQQKIGVKKFIIELLEPIEKINEEDEADGN